MDSNTTWRAKPEVEVQELEGNLVLVHLGTNRLFELNETATRFWELLVSGHGFESIFNEMVGEYEVEPEELRRELEENLAMLINEDLVVSDAGR